MVKGFGLSDNRGTISAAKVLLSCCATVKRPSSSVAGVRGSLYIGPHEAKHSRRSMGIPTLYSKFLNILKHKSVIGPLTLFLLLALGRECKCQHTDLVVAFVTEWCANVWHLSSSIVYGVGNIVTSVTALWAAIVLLIP
ncbi:hypothetical protein VNO77_17008 [Canavalia gladiata]|uniref:Uncharacterized protein n=1 Tax=Canavalia gladiata TaxID=3824 RepID=A0AAN9LIG0_CANGL